VVVLAQENPCIRFGHTIPVAHSVDVTITQGSVTHTWANYKFAEFSGVHA
jgi:hypothetical protein